NKKADPVHVVVKVDGRRWRQVLSLSGSRSDDRHYVLETRPNGSATVQFGDGAHGASASKASRVEITYRTGGGGAGNVRLCLRRTATPPRDLVLGVAIRTRTHAVNFGGCPRAILIDASTAYGAAENKSLEIKPPYPPRVPR